MYRIDNATAYPLLPVASVPGVQPDGYFSAGNPNGAVPSTIVDAEWVNMVQEELANCVSDEGKLDPILSKAFRNQLLAAIRRECQAIKGGDSGGHPTPPLEYYTADRLYGAALPLGAANAIGVAASFTLPPGVWDLWGHIGFVIPPLAQATMLGGCIGVQYAYEWVNGDTGLSTQYPYAPDLQGSGIPELMQFYCGRAVVGFATATPCYLQGVWRGGGVGGFSIFGFMAARRLGLPPGGLDALAEQTKRNRPYTGPALSGPPEAATAADGSGADDLPFTVGDAP